MNYFISKVSALFLLSLSLTLSLVACDTKEKLDGMHKSTENIEKTSKELAEDTGGLRADGREAFTRPIQDSAYYDIVLNSNKGVTQRSEGATAYYGSLPFQHWRPTEGEDVRDTLNLVAVRQTLGKLLDLIDDGHPVTPFLLPSNEWMSLSIMAIGMSVVHPDQVLRSKKDGFTAVSFYDLVKEALIAGKNRQPGEVLPEWQWRLLQHEKELIYILQLRHNFFNFMVLGNLSNFEDNMFNQLWMLKLDWTENIEGFTNDEMSSTTEFLWKAVETQAFLKSIGEPPQFNSMVSEIYSHARIQVQHNPEIANISIDALPSLEEVFAAPARPQFYALLPLALGGQQVRYDILDNYIGIPNPMEVGQPNATPANGNNTGGGGF